MTEMDKELPDHIQALLGSPVVTSLDAYFAARRRFALAIIAGDRDAALAALEAEREQFASYLALIVERLDSRAAHFLADMYKHLDQAERQIKAIDQVLGLERPDDSVDDPTGFDAGRKL